MKGTTLEMYVSKSIWEKYPSIREAFRNKPITRLHSEDDAGYIYSQPNQNSEPPFSGGFYEAHCVDKMRIIIDEDK